MTSLACKRKFVNRIAEPRNIFAQIDPAATDKYFDMRRKDQQRALQLLREDPNLQSLNVVEAPLLDLEVRGVPALKYFGDQVWKDGPMPAQGQP